MTSIRCATPRDLSSFFELAREVEPLFGPMVDDPAFHAGMLAAMEACEVLCAEDEEQGESLTGGIAVSRDINSIIWLAVRETCRGRGIGGLLLERALQELDSTRPVRVTTFDGTAAAGRAARRLYERQGFVEVESGGSNPAGLPTVVMERAASSPE